MNTLRVIRMQRQRTKGWRAPAGAIYCSRPGPFCNPIPAKSNSPNDRAVAVARYREWMRENPMTCGLIVEAFSAAVDAAIAAHGAPAVALCWCPDAICHVETLIEKDAEAHR